MKEEKNLHIQIYSALVGLSIFIFMKYYLKKDLKKCQNTSAIIGSLVIIYIVLFGLRLPTDVNKNIF